MGGPFSTTLKLLYGIIRLAANSFFDRFEDQENAKPWFSSIFRHLY